RRDREKDAARTQNCNTARIKCCPTCSDGTVPARKNSPNNRTSNGAPPMRRYPLAASIALIVAGMSFNAAAQSVASDQELAELRAQIAALQAKVDGLESRSQELEARSDAQSEVNIAQAATNEQLDDVASLKKLVNDTRLSGRLYYDLTSIDDRNGGAKTDKSG